MFDRMIGKDSRVYSLLKCIVSEMLLIRVFDFKLDLEILPTETIELPI